MIAGNSKGKEGKVLEIISEKDRAVVEDVNIITKATKPNAKHPQGGLIKKEAPIHISNLMLIDPSTGKPTRIGRKKNSAGKSVRYSKKTKEEIK